MLGDPRPIDVTQIAVPPCSVTTLRFRLHAATRLLGLLDGEFAAAEREGMGCLALGFLCSSGALDQAGDVAPGGCEVHRHERVDRE